jgi:predicted TIM-barrel fold metal-dependent hydrolase
VVEPPRVWDELLPARYRDVAPRVVPDGDGYRFACGGRVGFWIPGSSDAVGAPGQTPKVTDSPVVARGASDGAPRLDDMAIDRIDRVALYPTYGLMIQAVTDREAALALCRAVNDWMAEYCSCDTRRLVGIGTLPMTDAADALAEARRCIEDLGFRGVWRRPEHFGSLPRLQDDEYEPLWSYLEDVDAPFAIHPGMSGLIPYDELERRFDDDFSALHAAHFVVEQTLALTTFVASGILERHPSLRVAFLESGAVWAMSYLHRLDEHLELWGFDRAQLTLRPSDYFRRLWLVSVVGLEPGLETMLSSYPDSIVFASDYPHADGVFPGSTKELLGAETVDEATRRRMLRDNALRLYGLAR